MDMNSANKYKQIVKHYEDCLEQHGDTHKGVDWPNQEDVVTRYNVMLDLIYLNKERNNCSLLDFGCGTAHLFEHILQLPIKNQIEYSGLDLSEKFISVCKKKFPETTFFCGDVLDENFRINNFDYIVLNGVFTEKRNLSFDEMWNYFTSLLTKVFHLSNRGIAFNVMSKQVDWERDDLFHVPLDLLATFLCKNLSRHFVIRNDYGLYEYTVYLYKK
jgi:SAM-dependent methyltransferase